MAKIEHDVAITHSDRMYYPRDHITKLDVIEYYRVVASRLLAQIQKRPIVMQRFPEGIDGKSFYHKRVPPYFPAWIERIKIPLKDRTRATMGGLIINSVEDLIYVVNQGCLVLHGWLSQKGSLNKPDKIVFDLDPGARVPFGQVKTVALALKTELIACGLEPYVMVTGSRGVHVIVCIQPDKTFESMHAFAYNCAQAVEEKLPELITLSVRKKERDRRVFIDYLRNSYGQTSVVPYSLRARDGAPVAMPVSWQELDEVTSADFFTMKKAIKRILDGIDPWADAHMLVV
ncbi:MAG: polymerase LigD, polymerase domain protein [candidate division TM6 bacterium GW2011_GWE2_41_16]|nr:MAG: polymerase LigD, polymerase domain protein [candidate division TM6 bacterium GW2011_GWE2_41_16]